MRFKSNKLIKIKSSGKLDKVKFIILKCLSVNHKEFGFTIHRHEEDMKGRLCN